jgi:Alw26I/Eco31I/Esp3I family type II restriction m6 adenine DNA methyltransferase
MKNKALLEELLSHEEYLVNEFLTEIGSKNPTQEVFTKEDLLRYNLIRHDEFNAAVLAHEFLIQKLMDFAFSVFFQNDFDVFKVYNFTFLPEKSIEFEFLKKIDKNSFVEILENLHINFLNSEFLYKDKKLKRVKSKINLKNAGSVYTQSQIAKEITVETLKHGLIKDVNKISILDFGCGTGRFYFSILEVLHEKFGCLTHKYIKNIYAIDSNKIALSILKIKVLLKYGIEYLPLVNQNIIQRNMLILDEIPNQESEPFNLQNDFPEVWMSGGFDIIVSNPPYFLLKINKNKLNNDNVFQKYYQIQINKLDLELNYFRNSNVYNHSIEGMLNYYKLSIEMILQLTKDKGEIGVICPSTLFGDISSGKLRKFILENNQLRKITFHSERARLFDGISQATAIFYASKSQKTQVIDIKNDDFFQVSYDLIKNTFSKNLEIPQMDEIGWGIVEKLNHFQKLKDFNNLRNRRGEFDLLKHKNLITEINTGFRLIRGNMIGTKETSLNYGKQQEFVEITEFKNTKSSEFLKFDFKKVRLVCQQISNIDSKKRLNFSVCGESDVLANSCNYITANCLSDLKNLQILLNSYVLNWRFKVTSSNNHINNYELDELPLIDLTKLKITFTNNELENNVEIAKRYNLNKFEILYLLEPFFSKTEILCHL